MWDPKIESAAESGNSATTTTKAAAAADFNNKLVEDQYTDSGFMSSGLLSSSDIQDHLSEATAAKPITPPSVDQPEEQDSEKKKLQQAAVETFQDSGLVSDADIQSSFAEQDNMLLERGINDGLADKFGEMKLKNCDAAGATVNNLGKKSVSNSSSSASSLLGSRPNISTADQQQPRSKKQKNTNNGLQMPEKEQVWEACYKQDSNGDTYLHSAAAQGALDLVFYMIRITPHPCLLDIQNDLLQSPLHLAALVGHPQIVRKLLLSGAETSVRDIFGNTPLHTACNNGDVDCVRALTERITASELTTKKTASTQTGTAAAAAGGLRHQIFYPDLELRNYQGEHCVHIAVIRKSESVLRQLIEQGADLNAREGKAGFTPLHLAVEMGQLNLVNVLLEEHQTTNVVNLEQKTYAGWTAYQLASSNSHQEIMKKLLSKGAQKLDVELSSSDDSDDSDVDDSEMMGMYGSSVYFNQNLHHPLNTATAINVA